MQFLDELKGSLSMQLVSMSPNHRQREQTTIMQMTPPCVVESVHEQTMLHVALAFAPIDAQMVHQCHTLIQLGVVQWIIYLIRSGCRRYSDRPGAVNEVPDLEHPVHILQQRSGR